MDQQNLQQPDENQPEKIPSIPLGEPEEQKPSKKYLFLIIIAFSNSCFSLRWLFIP